MITYIGIDPGKTGGLAAVRSGNVIAVAAMPLAGNMIDGVTLHAWLIDQLGTGNILVALEKVSAMPKQGVKSMFTFGMGYGIVQGVLAAIDISYQLVTPQAWKKVILAGTPKDKMAAIEYCLRMYPYVSLLATERSKVPHNGIADAICIAAYASQRYKR
jgi:crossover junction endodeoxyribonuclease RuvC